MPQVKRKTAEVPAAGTITLPLRLRVAAYGVDQLTRGALPPHQHGPACNHGVQQLQMGLTRPLFPDDGLRPTQVRLLRGGCDEACTEHHGGTGLRPAVAGGPDVQELPKCCQQALDLDEPIAAIKALFDRAPGGSQAHSHGAGHDHSGWLGHLHGFWEWAIAGATGYAAGFGVYFGILNMKHSTETLGQLRAAEDEVNERLKVLTKNDTGRITRAELKALDRPTRTAVRNLVAQKNGLIAGKGMQKFIRGFAGLLPIVSSSLMFCGVAVPPLALVSTALLGFYCFSHAIRYSAWDLLRAAESLPAELPDAPQVVEGAKVFAAVQKQRRAIFAGVAGCFVAYGAGAVGFVAASVGGAALAPLMGPSMLLLVAGMVAVTYLNNVSIPKAFISNQNTHIDRQHLGSKASILRQLQAHDKECQEVRRWSAEDTPQEGWGPWFAARAMALLSYVTTFGVTMGWVNRWQHRRRVRAYERAPEALLRFIEPSCRNKVALLSEEIDEVRERQTRFGATAVDRASYRRTEKVLEGWRQEEDELADGCGMARTSAEIGARVWEFLAKRDLLDEMKCTVANRLQGQGTWGAWWEDGDADVVLQRDAWIRALSEGDAAAEGQLRMFCGETIHYLKHHYEAALQSRRGALVDQLVGRIQEKAQWGAEHPV